MIFKKWLNSDLKFIFLRQKNFWIRRTNLVLTFLITIFEPLYFVKMGQISSQTPLSKKSNTPLKLVFRQKLSQFCRLKIDDPYHVMLLYTVQEKYANYTGYILHF